MGISSSGYQRPRQIQAPSQATTTSTSLVTALSVSGTGRLVQIATFGGTNPPTVKITVDGVVVFNAAAGTTGTYYYPLTTKSTGGAYQYTTTPINIDINFRKTLLIEHSVSGAGSANTQWAYELE